MFPFAKLRFLKEAVSLFYTFHSSDYAATKDIILPLNDVILAGSVSEMRCSLESNMRWLITQSHLRDGVKVPICIGRRHYCNDNFSMKVSDDDTFTLIINTTLSSSFNFAGTYFCQTPRKVASAQLIVLGEN